ncbi:MAG: ribonuclease P protein component 4 [Methanomassiliicoccales archaeon]
MGGRPTGKKRVSPRVAKAIAGRRIEQLLRSAEEECRSGNLERGRRYVTLARKIGMRTNTRMPKEHLFCRECNSPLIPGRNCTVRLRNARLTMRCEVCGSIKRMPYLREKREKDDR